MKRAFDIVVAAAASLILLPVALPIALAIWATLGNPILFRQERPGLQGRPFTMLKFRTMRKLEPGQTEGTDDRSRLTRLGRLLRSSSLDELPELWNVLRGEMSLVGPRPLLMDYLPLYSGDQFRRHEVRPGITGWAQIKGRNALSWGEKFALDCWYVDNRSFALDLYILGATILQVILRRNISAEGHATMPRFEGSNNTREP